MNIIDGTTCLKEVEALIKEYTKMLGRDLSFQHLDEELTDLKQKYSGKQGRLLAAVADDGMVAGCVAYHRLCEDCCEMKRLYVQESYRNCGIGHKLAEHILALAKKDGYQTMVLDTIEPLQSAVRLYQRLGIQETAPYYNNPMDDVIYMKKNL
ncbi:GNAT family N-acetyltransferase [[Clostridium] innocuum]|nr:GNAT family N-acetyltransferase [[Clostridium] innocuum]